MKQKVTYSVLDKDRYIVEVSKILPDEQTACSFFREIKPVSVTKPIISDLHDKKDNDDSGFF